MPVTCMWHACVEHACYMCVPCMLHACTMHVTCMIHACYMHAACMLHTCTMHVTCMFHACNMYGIYRLGVNLGLNISSVTCTQERVRMARSGAKTSMICYSTVCSSYMYFSIFIGFTSFLLFITILVGF